MAGVRHQDSLVARIRQRFCSVIFASVLLLYGLIFVWHGLPHTDYVLCARTSQEQIDCQRQKKVLWWIPIQNIQFDQLQAVQLGTGENTDNSTVYFIVLRGENRNLNFGHTLDSTEIQPDRLKVQQFLQDSNAKSLRLERYKADWIFVLLGLPLGALGVWALIYRYH